MVDNLVNSDHPFSAPKCKNGPQVWELGEFRLFDVNVHTDESDKRKSPVHVDKGLVESVPQWRHGQEDHAGKDAGSNHAPLVAHAGGKSGVESRHSTGAHCIDSKGDSVKQGLDKNHSCTPAVEEVEGVVRYSENGDEGVVTECKEDSGDDVECCQLSTATTKLSQY